MPDETPGEQTQAEWIASIAKSMEKDLEFQKGRAKALEETLKRVLAAMQRGVYIYSADGHRWIHVDEEREEYPFPHEHLESCKVYGGIHAALDALDTALEEDKRPSLLEFYKDNCDWLGFFD